MPGTVSEECESERRRTQDLVCCVGSEADGVGVSRLISRLTRSLWSAAFKMSHREDHSVAPLAEDLSEDQPYTNFGDVGRIGVIEAPMNAWGEMEDIGDKRSNGVHCLVHRPVKRTTGFVSVRKTMIDSTIALDQQSVCRIVTAKDMQQIRCMHSNAIQSQVLSLFVVYIGTPRQQVSSDVRTEQVVVENEVEIDSVVAAFQQDLEPLYIGNATDPIVVVLITGRTGC